MWSTLTQHYTINPVIYLHLIEELSIWVIRLFPIGLLIIYFNEGKELTCKTPSLWMMFKWEMEMERHCKHFKGIDLSLPEPHIIFQSFASLLIFLSYPHYPNLFLAPTWHVNWLFILHPPNTMGMTEMGFRLWYHFRFLLKIKWLKWSCPTDI